MKPESKLKNSKMLKLLKRRLKLQNKNQMRDLVHQVRQLRSSMIKREAMPLGRRVEPTNLQAEVLDDDL